MGEEYKARFGLVLIAASSWSSKSRSSVATWESLFELKANGAKGKGGSENR